MSTMQLLYQPMWPSFPPHVIVEGLFPVRTTSTSQLSLKTGGPMNLPRIGEVHTILKATLTPGKSSTF
jgi:hypothetical protein